MNRIEQLLKQNNQFDEQAEKSFKEKTRKEIIDILNRNEKELKPPISNLFTDVYDEISELQKDQYNDLKEHLQEYGQHYPTKNFQKEQS